MPAPSSTDRVPLVTVLYIGSAPGLLADRLRDERIGVVGVDRLDRGLRLLSNFRAAAVICDVPDLQAVAALTATRTPVVLLAAGDAEPPLPGVTVVNRRTPAQTLAEIIRRIATERPDRTRDAA